MYRYVVGEWFATLAIKVGSYFIFNGKAAQGKYLVLGYPFWIA
jgi:hypothetical protein